ncbi:protein of unknown function [Dyadobacter soli]|uniref:DarT domain-containing protein n=2 Tax=Dyadobacter soli TaxID=659014 RepID=A0A1G7QJ47_9BACT|nr:protein of unknown function [Dyadobacter soli]
MLFNIKTGYRGIRQRSQSEIIYIVCEANSIVDACDKWCFIDGHAKNHITEFFNQLVDLDHVNWDVVRARYWHNDDDNYDKMRQKQAEFLVKDHVPAKCINAIVVFDSETENIVNLVLQRNGMNISVYVNPNNNFYY